MKDLYPYMFTYGGPQLFMWILLLVLTPAVYSRLKKRSSRARWMGLAALWGASIIVAYGDVLVIAVNARELCATQAGMRIYATDVADGFLGDANIRLWAEYGFDYVEWRWFVSGVIERHRMVSGTPSSERGPHILSRHERKVEEAPVGRLPIRRQRRYVVRIDDGKVLGEIIAFKFYPAWMDRLLLSVVPGVWIPLRCDGNHVPAPGRVTIFPEDLIKATLVPRR